MSLDALTWRASAVHNLSAGPSVADMLAAIKALVDSEVAANPESYQWSVSDYDAVNGTLELKPKASAVANVRLLFFGGSSPNAAAIAYSTAGADRMYLACAPTAGTTGPDNDYTTGAPYNTDHCQGAEIFQESDYTLTDKLRYYETEETIIFVWYDGSAKNDTGCAFGGAIFELAANTRGYGVGGNNNPMVETIWSAGSSPGKIIPDFNVAPSAGYPMLHTLGASGASAYCSMFDIYAGDNFFWTRLTNGAYNYFLPIGIGNNVDGVYAGLLRQMYMGPNAMLATAQLQSGAVAGHAVSCDISASNQSLWLLNTSS